MQFSPAGTMIMAGVLDGTNAACSKSSNMDSASVVTKHVGKAFGARAAANTALRNGLARWALGRDLPLDNFVRLFDCLGALPKIEFFSINQMGLEREIARSQKQFGKDSKSVLDESPSETPSALRLEPVDLAAKRFFDGTTLRW